VRALFGPLTPTTLFCSCSLGPSQHFRVCEPSSDESPASHEFRHDRSRESTIRANREDERLRHRRTYPTGKLMIIGTLSPAFALGSPSQIASMLDSAFVRLCSPFNPVETTSVVFLYSSLSRRTKTESDQLFSRLTTVARIACLT
jgi:hypothetical protein